MLLCFYAGPIIFHHHTSTLITIFSILTTLQLRVACSWAQPYNQKNFKCFLTSESELCWTFSEDPPSIAPSSGCLASSKSPPELEESSAMGSESLPSQIPRAPRCQWSHSWDSSRMQVKDAPRIRLSTILTAGTGSAQVHHSYQSFAFTKKV